MSEPKDDAQKDTLKVPLKTRVTVKKWRGTDTSGEPFETVVSKDEGFDEAVERLKKEEKDHAPD